MTSSSLSKLYVDTPFGAIHLASAGEGFPVLLLHQTPRSHDEYRDVLPILGRDFRAIAMDTPGFGASEPTRGQPASIEVWAQAALAALDALGIAEAAVVGHHTGAAIALETAAAAPTRVRALALSACPFVDEERRRARVGHRVIDDVEARADGGHLQELWKRRQPFYPADDIDLLTRFIADALRAGPMAVEGHRIVYRYPMETRIGLVKCPTLVLAPTDDPHAYPAAPRVAAAIAGSVLQDVAGAMVPFPDQAPEKFAELVVAFVAAHAHGRT